MARNSDKKIDFLLDVKEVNKKLEKGQITEEEYDKEMLTLFKKYNG